MIAAISQVCSLPSRFEQDIEDYAAAHCQAVDVWLTKLETVVQQHGAPAARQVLEQNGVSAPAASFQGGLLASQGEARREAWQLFQRRLELCSQVGIATLVLAADVPAPLNEQTLDRVVHSLKEGADQAAAAGVRLALEFQAGSAYVNNLQTAAALVHELAHPALGICLDVFHWYTGPSKLEDLGYLTEQTLFHVQVCDLADTPRELASDSDRILPGEGDIPLGVVIQHLERIGYRGAVSLEVMNPQLWQVPPRQFGEVGITSVRRVLGQATMQ